MYISELALKFSEFTSFIMNQLLLDRVNSIFVEVGRII
jgi:hypothetical protein